MQHLQKMFDQFKEHNCKFCLSKCQFFHFQVEYLGHMMYPSGLGVQKAIIKAILQVPQPTNVS